MPAGNCPVCDAAVTLVADVKASEVVPCLECKTKLVVQSLDGEAATLVEAPKVEEDWGQ
jgi:lysine biosynthesis protein LysW